MLKCLMQVVPLIEYKEHSAKIIKEMHEKN